MQYYFDMRHNGYVACDDDPRARSLLTREQFASRPLQEPTRYLPSACMLTRKPAMA